MRYDLRFAKEKNGVYEIFAVPLDGTPMYGLGEIMRAAMEWDFVKDKYYNLAAVYPTVKKGVKELIRHAVKYEAKWPATAVAQARKCLAHLVVDIEELAATEDLHEIEIAW